MLHPVRTAVAVLTLHVGMHLAAQAPVKPPVAPVRDVVENYFGHEVHDPYRYLESDTDEAKNWIRQQGAYTESVLAARPEREKIRKRIRELDAEMGLRFQWVTKLPGDMYLYSKSAPGQDTFKLFLRHGIQGPERLLVDPEQFRKAGGPAASLEAVYPSPSGKLIAYAITIGNSERAMLHVMNAATGKDIEAPFPNVLRFTTIGWSPNEKSFFYQHMPQLPPDAPTSDKYLNVAAYQHILGTDASKDRHVVGPDKNLPLTTTPTQWANITLPKDSRWAICTIGDGVKNEVELYFAPQNELQQGSAKWKKIAGFDDQVTQKALHGDDLYLITNKGAARGKIVKVRLPEADLAKVQDVVAEKALAPFEVGASRDALYAVVREGPQGRLFRISYATSKAEDVKLPMDGIPELYSTDPRMDGLLFTVHGWTRRPGVYSYVDGKLADTNMNPISAAEKNADLDVTHAEATSHDGVKIPLTIVHKRGLQKNGDNKVWLIGYGSYSVPMDPNIDPFVLTWYERGGVLAVAHVRGGGEFGEEWHAAGTKKTKPNTWLDFIACAEYLISNRYTRPERLAGSGVSAGGIMIGRAITERPDLFGAALDGAGTTDMVRGEFQKNGPVNTPEFGSVKNEDEFPALLEMSAYHHVKDGTKYPAVMLSTGWNDPVVDPWQPAKMTARLQAATTSGKPILLRLDDGGHDQWGSTRSQLQALRADQLTFLLWQLGK